MKSIFYILLFILNSVYSNSQINSVYSNFIPVCGVSEMQQFNYASNPSIKNDSSNTFSLLISPSIHGISELNSGSLFYGRTISSFKPSLLISGLDNELFSEISASAQLAYQVSDNITVGSRFSYNFIDIADYSANSFFSIDIGGITNFSEQFSAGFVLFNINGGSYDDNPEMVFRTAAFSLAGHLSSTIGTEVGVIIRNYNSSGIFVAGKAKMIDDLLSLSAGFLTKPQSFRAQIQINPYNNFNILFEMNFRQELDSIKNIGIINNW